jgi:phospholipase C
MKHFDTVGPSRIAIAATYILLLAVRAAFADTFDKPPTTTTPIKYVVIIFDENRSFDHYFGIYPNAANPAGEPRFVARLGTPRVNGLSGSLLNDNPNLVNPIRLDRSQAKTCDQNHAYSSEQLAFDRGLMDMFVQFTGTREPGCDPASVMGYFDGNTVTALWNYAQHFAISDNFYGTTFGPSMPGAINLASGQTHGVIPSSIIDPSGEPKVVGGTLIGNEPAKYDDCATESGTKIELTGRNIGNLLNNAAVTWGWFVDGFRPDGFLPDGTALCTRSHSGSDGNPIIDYDDPDPFEYYKSTSNQHHLPPTSVAMVGRTDRANHNYDITDYFAAAETGHAPAVAFLRPPEYRDGHPEQSDPLAEQTFLVQTINHLQKLPEWDTMAVFITWDDSDGWYDHEMPPIVKQSNDGFDFLTGKSCGSPKPGSYPGRCGQGPRLPLVVISPYARENFVDNTLADQSSIIRFVEDNWNLGRIGDQSYDADAGSLMNLFDFKHNRGTGLFLNPDTGEAL